LPWLAVEGGRGVGDKLLGILTSVALLERLRESDLLELGMTEDDLLVVEKVLQEADSRS
jgi:hypothetical protein